MSQETFKFWRVIAETNCSKWQEHGLTFQVGTPGAAMFSSELSAGASKLKFDPVRDWNAWHGCPNENACNIQVIIQGVLEVQVGDTCRRFGPNQPDGKIICFADVLDSAHFYNGHRTRVIDAVLAYQVQLKHVETGK